MLQELRYDYQQFAEQPVTDIQTPETKTTCLLTFPVDRLLMFTALKQKAGAAVSGGFNGRASSSLAAVRGVERSFAAHRWQQCCTVLFKLRSLKNSPPKRGGDAVGSRSF